MSSFPTTYSSHQHGAEARADEVHRGHGHQGRRGARGYSRGYPARPVARDWHHLFVTDGRSFEEDAPDPGQGEERRRGFFGRLRESMRKTREALAAEVQATLFEGDLDEATWERLEEALIYADVGARTTAEVVEKLEREAEEGDLAGGEALTQRLAELLAELARTGDDTIDIRPDPAVILVVGVNGTGKTTTIGKLAWHLRHTLGQKVVLAAADTFRAAAVEQLELWAERADVDLVKGHEGSDPGAVAFDAVARGRERGADVVIIDTAGRLHTQHNLMEELTKVRRVITKQMPDAPHETLLASTPPPARTASARRSSSATPSTSPASSSPSSTAPPRAASRSRSPTSSASRSS